MEVKEKMGKQVKIIKKKEKTGKEANEMIIMLKKLMINEQDKKMWREEIDGEVEQKGRKRIKIRWKWVQKRERKKERKIRLREGRDEERRGKRKRRGKRRGQGKEREQ